MYDLIVCGYAGLSGSLKLYEDKDLRKRLLTRYEDSFFRRAFDKDSLRFICKDSKAHIDKGEDGLINDFAAADISPRGCKEALKAILCEYKEKDLLYEAGEGGVYAALWKFLREKRLGASFSQRAIPIKQQTIELCESFELDPYRLESYGTAVLLSNESANLIEAYEAVFGKRSAAVIGHTHKGKAIERTDGDSTAYLRRPEADEIHKLI